MSAGEGIAARGPRDSGARRRYFHRCSCGRPIPEGVMRCSSRTCPEYAPTWTRDTRRRLMENDPRFCVHSPSQKCSGRLGCRVDPDAAEAFNKMAGKWWSELHRAAKTRADRPTEHKGKLLGRVWEKQKRGLAHVHGIVAVESPIERAWAEAAALGLDYYRANEGVTAREADTEVQRPVLVHRDRKVPGVVG